MKKKLPEKYNISNAFNKKSNKYISIGLSTKTIPTILPITVGYFDTDKNAKMYLDRVCNKLTIEEIELLFDLSNSEAKSANFFIRSYKLK